MSLILASGSPRRRELMALITPNYTVAPSDVDESRITAATPAQLAQALAEVRPPLCGKSRYGIYCQPCHIQIANGSLPIPN